MLRAVPMFPQPSDGVLEGDFDRNGDWPQYVNIELARWMVLEMGDPKTGPAITMLTKRPGSVPGLTDDLIEDKSQLAHFHRSDVFRMALGADAEQVNHAGKFLNSKDFFVMRASKRYTESLGLGDVRFLDVYADRRGVPATMAENKVHPAYEDDMHAVVGQLFCEPPTFHRDEGTVVTGVGTSFAPVPSSGRLRSSFTNEDGWTRLSDGSSVAVAAIGDPTSGPLVILSRSLPASVEPSATWSTDVYRLVVEGSCTVGGTTLGERQFRAIASGIPEGDVVHGPDGSAQVLVVADRRAWRPSSNAASHRHDELAVVIDKTLSAIEA